MLKRPKYGNTKCSLGNLSFDSKKEMQRYLVLKEAQDKGIIADLTLQPKFELVPKMTETFVTHLKTKDKVGERLVQRAITYSADFSYKKDGKLVVEDVKISPKMLPPEFVLKMKMMMYFHHIAVKLVFKPDDAI